MDTGDAGTIIISSGTITATGAFYAAGIGGGTSNADNGGGGAVTITGGTVTASGIRAIGAGGGNTSHGTQNVTGTYTWQYSTDPGGSNPQNGVSTYSLDPDNHKWVRITY
jgi:hypothetical protein